MVATSVPAAFQAQATTAPPSNRAFWSSSGKTPWADLPQSMSVGSRLSSVSSGRPGAASHSPELGCQAHWKRGLSSSRAVWDRVFSICREHLDFNVESSTPEPTDTSYNESCLLPRSTTANASAFFGSNDESVPVVSSSREEPDLTSTTSTLPSLQRANLEPSTDARNDEGMTSLALTSSLPSPSSRLAYSLKTPVLSVNATDPPGRGTVKAIWSTSSGSRAEEADARPSPCPDAAASTNLAASTTYARPWRPLLTASAPSSPLRAKAPAYSSSPNWRSRAMVVAACCGWQF
mmetsp:Transcript_2501/g.7155  ORF Transcript_2501/g.7155 Transcript_2501/m.7155 type:complete len:292 (+) Transcript_2501:695-1570(+)